MNTFKKNLVKGNLDITGNYFNTSIFQWEPALEKVDVIFHQLIYRGPPEEEIEEYFIGKDELKEKVEERKKIKKMSLSESTEASSVFPDKNKWTENKFSSI